MLDRNLDPEGPFANPNVTMFVKAIDTVTPVHDGDRLRARVKFSDGTEDIYDQVILNYGSDNAALPRLEDLAFHSPKVPNPCEILFSDNWATVTGHREVELSPYGDELEARYGFKRFLHAASRLSIYPCSDGALDRLPLLDEDIVVTARCSRRAERCGDTSTSRAG